MIQYFTSLKLANGYWKTKVHPSQAKTAFVTHQCLHELRMMPFGLPNTAFFPISDATLVLTGFNPDRELDFISVYMHVNLVLSPTLAVHLEHLDKVLS